MKQFDSQAYEYFIQHASEKHECLSKAVGTGLKKRLLPAAMAAHPYALDIGAGEGSLSVPVLTSLESVAQAGKSEVAVVLIEPDARMLLELTRRLDSQRAKGGAALKALLSATFERTSSSGLLPESCFSFILASHVFYYFDNWPERVKEILRFLSEGGIACVVVKSNQTDLYRLRSELPWAADALVDLGRDCFAEDFQQVLTNLGVAFETEVVEYPFTIPAIDAAGDIVANVCLLFAFWYGIATDKWSNEVRKRIDDFVRFRCDGAGNMHLRYREMLFWITRAAG